jgi:hypothetical protein
MVCEQLATTSTTLKEQQKGGAAVRLAQTATVSGGAAVRKPEFLSSRCIAQQHISTRYDAYHKHQTTVSNKKNHI